MEDARWVQYRVFAEARLNFSRQFLQVVAFMLASVLGGAVLASETNEPLRAWLILGAGAVLLGTAFVAQRVRMTEDAYEALLHRIETESGTGLIQPRSGRFGAKTLVVAALVLAGSGLLAIGASRLAG